MMKSIVKGQSLELSVKERSIGNGYVALAINDAMNIWETFNLDLGIDFKNCESDERHVIAQALREVANDIDGADTLDIAFSTHTRNTIRPIITGSPVYI